MVSIGERRMTLNPNVEDEEGFKRSRPEILIAEDGSEVREFLSYLLVKELNVLMIQAKDGEEAIRHIDRSLPDLLILDLKMPSKSGIDVLKAIEPKGYKFPILIISGYFDSKNEIMSRINTDSSRIYFLKKPFEASILLEEVKKILKI